MGNKRRLRAHFVIFGAALSGLLGCTVTTTTAVSPFDLPSLAASSVTNPKGWHDAHTPSGQPILLKGEIKLVTIEPTAAVANAGLSGESFKPPFQSALLDGWRLGVSDREHGPRLYAMQLVGGVSVEHVDGPASRTRGGVGLLLASVFPLVVAGIGFAKAAEWSNSHASGLGQGIWYGFAATGCGLLVGIPGIYLIASDETDPRKSEGAGAQGTGTP